MASAKAKQAYLAAGQDPRPEAVEANADAWFKQAVKSGMLNPDGSPRQGLKGAQSREMEGEGHSGYNAGTGAMGAIPSDTTGIRAHARSQGMSEDFDRFDEATLALWEKHRDSKCPPKFPYRMSPDTGGYNPNACVEKPIDGGGVVQNAGGGWEAAPSRGGGQQQGGGGGRPGPPPPPPKPTTFGQQLSYTGNPMQDMLIQQFNARTSLQDPSQANIFGMGTDRAVGGEGAGADKPMMAQTLAGGGLWRGAEDTFGGFRADRANVAKTPAKRGRGRRRRGGDVAPPPPDPAEIATPPSAAPTGPASSAPQPIRPPVTDMMKKRFGGKSTGFGGGGSWMLQ